MKNFSPVKSAISLAMLLLSLALIIGNVSMTIFADTTATETTVVETSAPAETTTEAETTIDTTAEETKATDDSEKSEETEKPKKQTEEEKAREEEIEKYQANTSWFDTIAIPFGYAMRGFNFVCGGIYPLSLLLFAIAMKIILFPFSIKQQKNSQKQAKLKPKEQAIRDKYAGRNDKVTQQKMQQEIQELYQREGFNPMGGCLPLLLQFPILFALLRVVYNPLRHILGLTADQVTKIGQNIMRLNPSVKPNQLMYDINIIQQLKGLSSADYATVTAGVDKIKDINAIPKMSLFGLDLSHTPLDAVKGGMPGALLILIPIVTFFAMYFSMKLTRKFTYQPQQADAAMGGCSGKTMDFVMPLFSTYIAVIWPSVLGIYWIYQNVLSVAQQLILSKMYPMPTFTKEDYAKAKQEMYGKQVKKKKNAGNARRNPKSLHHIDDDDDDDYETKAPAPKREEKPLADKENLPESKNSIVAPAALKEDVPAPKEKED